MEKRLILATVLMAALLILYQALFAPAPSPPVKAPVESKPAPAGSPPPLPPKVERSPVVPQRTV